jgi:hypothetical protein
MSGSRCKDHTMKIMDEVVFQNIMGQTTIGIGFEEDLKFERHRA